METALPPSPAVRAWMQRTGQAPSAPPAAYFNTQGRPRQIRAKTEDDVPEMALTLARSMRQVFGPIESEGHVAVRPHEQFVPPVSDKVRDGLTEAIFG
jgi:hypothetical protein